MTALSLLRDVLLLAWCLGWLLYGLPMLFAWVATGAVLP